MKDTTLRRILVFFLIALIVLIAVAVMSVRSIGRSTATSDWVNHTHAVIDRLDAATNALRRAGATLRAYTATGSEADLTACNAALADLTGNLELAQALTRQEPAVQAAVGDIQSIVEGRTRAMRAIMTSKQEDNEPEARRQLRALAADPGGLEIENRLVALKEGQLVILSERDTASYLQAQSTRWIVWIGVAVNFLLLGGAGWLLRDDLAARRRAAAALEQANSQLEAKVQERTAELVAANDQLSLENIERQWANQALEHQLHYNRNIVDSISDLVFVLTKAGAITRVNTAVLRFSGRDSAAFIKQPYTAAVRLRDGAAPDPVLAAMKEGRDLRDRAAFAVDGKGRDIAVTLSLYPLRDQNKVIGGIITLQITPPGSEGRA